MTDDLIEALCGALRAAGVHIYYGFDLAGYFAQEFAATLPDWSSRAPRPIRFWDDFL